MSENSGFDRWKSLADDLGLPPEKPVSEVAAKNSGNQHSVNTPYAGMQQDSPLDEDLLVFTKPVQRHSEPSKVITPVKTFPVPKVVEPRHQHKEIYNETEEVLEVTFGSHRAQEQIQTNKAQVDSPIVDAEIVESNYNSVSGNQSEIQVEQSMGSDRGRGNSRGGDQDRGGRGRGGRGRGREDNRNSNPNRNTSGPNRGNESESRVDPVEMAPAKMHPAPVRNDRAAPITFGQSPDSRTVNSDDEVLSGPESYGSHHPEQDGEIEEIDLSTWSVPSWEDLISSLYKP